MAECGSDAWIKTKPRLRSWKTRMVWWDMSQHRTEMDRGRDEGSGVTEGDSLLAQSASRESKRDTNNNWWPGLGRWRVGLWLDDAVLELGKAEGMDT